MSDKTYTIEMDEATVGMVFAIISLAAVNKEEGVLTDGHVDGLLNFLLLMMDECGWEKLSDCDNKLTRECVSVAGTAIAEAGLRTGAVPDELLDSVSAAVGVLNER